MSDAPDPMFKAALAELAKAEKTAFEIKAWINQGCRFAGREPMFPDLKMPGEAAPGQRSLSIGPDDFYNKPMATAVREVLTKREAAGMRRTANIDEIHDALRQGGFRFPSNDIDKQKMGLAVSLGKNTITFAKVPGGLFGLAEWYANGSKSAPLARKRRSVVIDEPEYEPEDGPEPEAEAEPGQDEAAESPDSDSSAASPSTQHSAVEAGREVEHDNMNH